jgi:hypothetical protein
MFLPVALPCPICNAFYEFSRDRVNTCPSCGYEITETNSDEDAPRIVPNPKKMRISHYCLSGGLLLIFLFPFGTAAGLLLWIVALSVSATNSYRCGNCGSSLQSTHTRYCVICHANLKFDVA